MGRHRAVVSEHRAGPTARRAGVLLLGAAASSALAVGALGSAGVANATCISVSGLNSGGDCISTIGPNIAVGIGQGATATAVNGVFGAAFAVGNGAGATETGGVFGTAISVGNGADTNITGVATTAVALGPGAQAYIIGKGSPLGQGPTATQPAAGDFALAAGSQALAFAGLGAGDVAIAVGNPGPNRTPITPSYHPTIAGVNGSLSNALAVGKGDFAAAGTSTAPPLVGIGALNNAVVIGNGSAALAGGTATGAPTGNGKLSVAIGNNKYVHH